MYNSKKIEISLEEINTVIQKLIKNNLLNDDIFTKAFINDKLNLRLDVLNTLIETGNNTFDEYFK